MAATQIAAGAGFRHARYWLLDINGYPDGTQSGSDGYSGRRIEGAKAYQANMPDPQTVRHTGDDRVLAQDTLPPTELETGSLTSAKTNFTADAELMSQLVRTLGDIQIHADGTDEAGNEPQVCLQLWRQALDLEEGSSTFGKARQWITYLYPSVRVVPKGAGMSEGAVDENSYSIVPTKVTAYPWGVAFTEVSEGFTEATKVKMITDFPLMIERFDAPGVVTTFLLDFTPISTVKTHAFVNGAEVTVSSVSIANKTVTLQSAPSASDVVVVLYEASDLK